MTTSVIVKPATARSLTAINTVVPGRKTRRRRNRNRSGTSLVSRANTLHPDAHGYVKCLSDPFTYPPVKLGFGCLTSTQCVTLTARYLCPAGSDGSISAFVIPAVNVSGGGNLAGGLYVSNAVGGAPLASTRIPWQNAQAVSDLLEEGRVVSCGLRMTPMVPGTSAPGGAFVASVPSVSKDWIDAQSKAALVLNPLFKWGLAAPGATACSRPIDPESFNFRHQTIGGYASNYDTTVTVPVIVMNGIPTGQTVFVEAVLQLEGIYKLNSQTQAALSLQATSAPSAMPRTFGTLENMWHTVSGLLPSATSVHTAVNLANRLLDVYDDVRGSHIQGRLMP